MLKLLVYYDHIITYGHYINMLFYLIWLTIKSTNYLFISSYANSAVHLILFYLYL